MTDAHPKQNNGIFAAVRMHPRQRPVNLVALCPRPKRRKRILHNKGPFPPQRRRKGLFGAKKRSSKTEQSNRTGRIRKDFHAAQLVYFSCSILEAVSFIVALYSYLFNLHNLFYLKVLFELQQDRIVPLLAVTLGLNIPIKSYDKRRNNI